MCAVSLNDIYHISVVAHSANPDFLGLFPELLDAHLALVEDDLDHPLLALCGDPIEDLPVHFPAEPGVSVERLAPGNAIGVHPHFPIQGFDPARVRWLHDEAMFIWRRFVDLEPFLSPLFRLRK